MPAKLALLVKSSVFVYFLIRAAAEDVKQREIPDRISIAICLCSMPMFGAENLLGILSALPVFIIALITGKIGGGDVKLIAANGVFLGVRANITAQIIGFVILLVFYMPKKMRTDEVPMAPFLSVGALIAMIM